MLINYIENAAVFLGLAALLVFMHRLTASRPWKRRGEEGVIRPARTLVTLIALAGLYLISGAGYYLIQSGASVIAALILAGGLGLILSALFMTGEENELCWDREGIEGPARQPLLPGRHHRMRLGWGELARMGRGRMGIRYVAAPDGRRISWSGLYAGHRAFEREIMRRRPDLSAPGSA